VFLRSLLSIALFAVMSLVSGCGGGKRSLAEVFRILEKADAIELYSLDPDPDRKQKAGGFREWKVLGRTTLTGDDKKAIVEGLQKGIADSDGKEAKCFNPRHGIEATHDGKTVELVICFECLSISGWNDGTPLKVLTTGGPAKEFNRVLEAKKVTLPKAAE
jgi:hypothetical protein